jgi:hypothetical protein
MKKKAIIEFFEKLPSQVIVALHNDYCERNNLDMSVVIDYDKLAEHLVDWGDAGYGFDITPHLMNKFKLYAYDLLQEEYTLQQVENWVETSQVDFLMDDWDDIILEFENVVAFCPHCKSVVFANAKHEYIYETAKILWECDNCGEEFVN